MPIPNRRAKAIKAVNLVTTKLTLTPDERTALIRGLTIAAKLSPIVFTLVAAVLAGHAADVPGLVQQLLMALLTP